MSNSAELKRQIKCMLVENLMLQNTADEIKDDQPLFGPGGLGLDSVDALQVVVALDKNYGLKIPDPETARKIILNVNTIAAAIEEHLIGRAQGLTWRPSFGEKFASSRSSTTSRAPGTTDPDPPPRGITPTP